MSDYANVLINSQVFFSGNISVPGINIAPLRSARTHFSGSRKPQTRAGSGTALTAVPI